MSIKLKSKWALFTAISVGLCFAASRLLLYARPAFLQGQPSVTPFTVELEVTSFVHDSRGEIHRRQMIAVRSDGSRSTTETIMGKVGVDSGEMSQTIRFADGRSVTMFLSLGVKNTWPVLGRNAVQRMRARMLNPPQGCVYPGDTPVGDETLYNQPVAILDHTSEELKWKARFWRASQLGCAIIGYRSYDMQGDGSFKLTAESRAINLNLGEPDAALFEDPQGYRETKPSEVGQILANKYHIILGEEQQKSAEVYDRAYLGTDLKQR